MEKRRKSVGFALALLLAALVLLPVFPVHAKVRQPIDEVGVSVVLPDEFQFVTRSSTEEECSNVYNVSKEEMLDFFTKNDSYLQGYNNEIGYDMQFEVLQTSDRDYNTYTDSYLFQYGKELAAQNEEDGSDKDAVASEMEVYTGAQGQKYLIWRIDYKEDDGSASFAIANRTCLDGVQYSFYVWPYDEDSAGAAKQEVLDILDKVEYPQPANGPVQPGTQPAQQGGAILPNNTQAISSDPLVTVLCTLVAVMVYLLPIVIYRYLIRKKPLKQGNAMPIALLYGTVALLIVAILGYTMGLSPLVAVAVLLCSVLVYLMLRSGSQPSLQADPMSAAQAQGFGALQSPQVPPAAPVIPNTPPVASPLVSSAPFVPPAPTMQSGVVPPAPPAVMPGTQPAAIPVAPAPPVVGPTPQGQPQQNQAAPCSVCRNCGRMLQLGDVYCGYCGTKAVQDTDLHNQ